MQSPAKLLWFMIFISLIFFLLDIVDIGTKKFVVEDGARNTTQTALMRSVEEGGIRTKHKPRTDLNDFYHEFYVYGTLNAGEKALQSKYTAIYDVQRLVPYAAAQMSLPGESKAMKYLKADDVWYNPRHRVIFIWDEKQ
ncbi:hypothetical protein M2444_004751 [Paenibacillus sp. PastF-3]|uniref:hypothetical protein n=1 Tax=unclassified Paenibacillus TaxID=185978 RepID=UPI000B9FFF7B|nr:MULTISPECIES: hypothetical protein [unclassified Paenibacillus]MDH6372922.1 hypothetical protein [Paenibacillus sp. PastF-3]OZQ85736.1 hypothetical protein CA598_19935 [Paenibacillus sp. VTT E-133291]